MSMNLPRALLALLLLSLSTLSPAKDSRMVPADPPGAAPADAAIVVFMRVSQVGGAIKATVYDVTDGQQEFIGIVSYKEKLAYKVKPGKHLFMVIAENGDFLDAEVEAGKTYYVVISPRFGVWKARFGFRPFRNDANAEFSTKKPDFAKWLEQTRWMQRGPGADKWYADHKADVTKKKDKYLAKWNERPADDKDYQTLQPGDGI